MASSPDAAQTGSPNRTGARLSSTRARPLPPAERLIEKLDELTELTTLLHEAPLGQLDFALVAARLARLAEAKAAIINSFDAATNLLRTEAIHADGTHLDLARRLFGYDPVGSVMDLTPEWQEKLRRGRLVPIDGIHDLMLGRFPAWLCHQLERVVGIGPIYCIGLTHRDEVLGGAIVLFASGHDLDFAQAIEVFAQVMGSRLLRKRAEAALAHESEHLATTLRSVGEGIVSTDRDGRIVLINQVAEVMLQHPGSEILGAFADQVLAFEAEPDAAPAVAPGLVKTLLTGECPDARAHRLRLARAGGSPLAVLVTGSAIRSRHGVVEGAVLVMRDVTRQERVEEELQRTRRLESLGLLAAGIAHNFNNVLQAGIGNLEIAQTLAGNDAELRAVLGDAEQALLGARSLTSRLLTFARGGAPLRGTVSLEPLVRRAVSEALREATRGVAVRHHFDPGIPAVGVDSEQISLVVKNLISNSIHAMPTGGTIDVSIRTARIAQGESSPVEPGEYVEVAVADAGTGIPAELLPHVLDPFGGSHPGLHGLGLSIASTIIRRHGGHLEIESKVGEGTRVRFLLPVALEAPPATPPPTRGEPCGAADGARSGGDVVARVLLMDDDPLVRSSTQRVLARLGYPTDIAAEGGEAVARYRQALAAGRPYALAILDLTVPHGMGGLETLRELRAIDPNVVAVIASGYGDDGGMARAVTLGFRDSIAKPYGAATLRELLEKLVGTAAT